MAVVHVTPEFRCNLTTFCQLRKNVLGDLNKINKLKYLWRVSDISISWFSYGSSILVELEFGHDGFRGGRKT